MKDYLNGSVVLNGNRIHDSSHESSVVERYGRQSPEVEEIFERTPGWILQHGILTIATLIFLLLVGSVFIKYPDIITTRITITTQKPPINVVARMSGKIHFDVKDGEDVKKDDILGHIESASEEADVFLLLKEMKKLQRTLFASNNYLSDEISIPQNLQVGESQSSYLQLLNSIKSFQLSDKLRLHEAQIRSLQDRITQYKSLNLQLTEQFKIQHEELNLVEKKFQMDEKLYKERVISEVDFNASKIALLQIKRAVASSENSIINNNITIGELESKVVESTINHLQSRDQLLQSVQSAFKQLESQLNAWQQQFILTAPSDGQVSIFKFYTDDQFVTAGVDVLAIVPKTGDIYGQVQMPAGGSGKVETSQRVVIKLDNFPSTEYGTVIGYVEAISPVPQENMYTIRIALPRGLKTTYKKELTFRQHLSGSADIVTKDLSLFQRFFFSIRSIVDSNQR